MPRFLIAFAVAALCLASPAHADKIKNEIQALSKAYDAGDITNAVESVRLLESWLMKMQAEGLGAVFLPLSGYEMEVGQAQALGQAMMGGGISASCEWTKGDETIEVQILGNSPLFGMVSGMISNTMMATASGADIERVAGHKIAVKNDGRRMEGMIPADGNTLVTIHAATKEQVMMAAESAIDWDKLSGVVSAP